MRRPRLPYFTRKTLELLRIQASLSYDDIVVQLDCGRSTAIQAIKRLEMGHHIVKVQGIGRQPNRYVLVERLATGAPSMTWPVAER
jgi:hypothetical protein